MGGEPGGFRPLGLLRVKIAGSDKKPLFSVRLGVRKAASMFCCHFGGWDPLESAFGTVLNGAHYVNPLTGRLTNV